MHKRSACKCVVQLGMRLHISADDDGSVSTQLKEYCVWTRVAQDATAVYGLMRDLDSARLRAASPVAHVCGRVRALLLDLPVQPGTGALVALFARAAAATAPHRRLRVSQWATGDAGAHVLPDVSDSQSWRLSEGATQAVVGRVTEGGTPSSARPAAARGAARGKSAPGPDGLRALEALLDGIPVPQVVTRQSAPADEGNNAAASKRGAAAAGQLQESQENASGNVPAAVARA